MFTVLHKWDGYTAHSMDQVAKYLYQYYDTQTTEKLCLLFNMLESNPNSDPSRSRWEADDRWIVHADDVAEIEWPGEKRLKRKHNQINHPDTQVQPEEDEKRTKAKRWDTFSKFLARIGFLKSSSKKSMAWVCSWTDTTGIFNRSKLKNAAQNGTSSNLNQPSSPSLTPSISPSITPAISPLSHLSLHNPSPSPTIHLSPPPPSIPSTPPSPQVPLSPHTPSSYPPPQYFPSSSSPSHLLPLLSNASDSVTVAYHTDAIPFSSFHSSNNTNTPGINPHVHFNNNTNNYSQTSHTPSSSSNNNNGNEREPEARLYSNNSTQSHNEESNNSLAPLSKSAEKVAPSYPPTFSLSSYLRDINESPFEYYENRGCVHAVTPQPILSGILRYLRVRLHRDWENFSFTARARTEANKDLIETVKECAWEHMLTRIPVIKINEGHSISSQIRKQFPPGRPCEPEEYRYILLAVLSATVNQHVIVRQRNLKFKNDKTSVKEVRKETAKGEFRLWSHIEPETQLVFPPALPSINKAYKYKDSFLHIATGLNLDSITKVKYNGQFLKFVKSKTVIIVLTSEEIELDITLLMKGLQHVGHNEYPVIPQLVTVNICSEVPKDGTILFGSYLKYAHNMRHESPDNDTEYPPPDQSGEFVPPPVEDVKTEQIDFTILHPNVICAHTTFSPELLSVSSWFVCGQRSFVGYEVSDILL